MYLDHVALATRDAFAQLGVLVGDLGGTLVGGGRWAGFQSLQVHLGDGAGGMKLELLEPFGIEENDFLERFVERHGDGPHHLTFKVGDIAAELARMQAAGFTPVSVDLSNPGWKEAFLLPREAHGTVVQLAESDWPVQTPREEYEHAQEHGPMEEPKWWGEAPPCAQSTTALQRVVVAAPVLDAAAEFFTGVLHGTQVDAGTGWVELEWPGGGRIRIEQRDDRRPGIDRLELEGDGDSRALDVAGTRLVVNP